MKYVLAIVAVLLLGFGIAKHITALQVAGVACGGFAALVLWAELRQLRRAQFIRTYAFPPGLFDKLAERRPDLPRKDMSLVARGLRQYFLAHLMSGRQFVSMPSQVADDLWHEFILYTRNYQQFCNRAFGKFFHHTPAVVLAPEHKADNTGLRRTWWYACKEENINPRTPARLPLLFALDAKLAIVGGFIYVANCEALRAQGLGGTYCGGDFSSSSVDGSTSGFGDAGSDGGSGDGGSDGGSGCGGGGCGGGGD